MKRAPRPEDPQVRFLVELARALGTYGTAADRIEEAVWACAHEMGIETHVFSTPTSVFISIEREHDNEYETYLSRITPGEVNLDKLRSIDEIFNAVIDGSMTPLTGIREIKQVVRRVDPVPVWLHVVSFAGVSAMASIFFGGGWREMLAAGASGAICGSLLLFVGTRREYARLYDFLSGFLAALVAALAGMWLGPLNPTVAILGGVIVLIPGLTITISLTELATRNVVSGSARFIGAVMILVLLSFGAAVGGQFAQRVLDAPPPVAPLGFPDAVKVASSFIVAFCFVVIFRARLGDWWVMLAAVLSSYYGSRLGVEWFGIEFGVCFAAMCVGSLGNLFGRFFNRPALTVVMPGLLMLVPGSIGFRSVQSLMSDETLSGIDAAFRVLIVGVALVVGLLLSNVIVRPRKIL